MSASSRSSQAVLVLMVAVVLLVVTGPTMVDAWCPRMGDSCSAFYPCCECDPNEGGRLLHCDLNLYHGLICVPSAYDPTCGSGKKCSFDGACQPYGSLEETVRETLGLPRKLSMKK